MQIGMITEKKIIEFALTADISFNISVKIRDQNIYLNVNYPPFHFPCSTKYSVGA